MKGYIYKYTFPDGKVYVGQTRRPMEIRHREHLNPSTGPLNPGFWDAYRKVGLPELSIIETIESEDLTQLVDELNRLETKYISQEKATNPEYGYNRMPFASEYSPDITILKKEYARLCQQAEEDKRAFFDSLSDKLFQGRESDLTEEESTFVEYYIRNNNIFTDDEEDLSEFILEDAIEYAIWRYNDETQEILEHYVLENAAEIIRKAKQGRIIQQMDEDGNVIREFESQDSIRKAFNIVRIDNILNVIKGRQKKAYGFRWRYKPNE